MIKIIKNQECCGCGACSNICPTNAISMQLDHEGFPYPQIDADKCIQCQNCTLVCPMLHKSTKEKEVLRAFACHALDNKLREKSTSGGLFATIAEYFIEEMDGIAYGVRFDEHYKAVYCSADRKEQITSMQGSKYVQADTENVYREIQNNLENQQHVLFTGMPCQVEALKCFLRKEYERLYTIDIICFGIASPGIWKDYLNAFHDVTKISQIVFKDKIDGWKNWKVKIHENDTEHYYGRKENLYMNSYLQRINIRPSCFHCPFKGIHRNSDFSIADCWGIGEKNKSLNDDKGLSALLLHTVKGQALFEKIKEKLRYEEYPPELLMEGNWALKNSPAENDARQEFFEKYGKDNFKEIFEAFFNAQS